MNPPPPGPLGDRVLGAVVGVALLVGALMGTVGFVVGTLDPVGATGGPPAPTSTGAGAPTGADPSEASPSASPSARPDPRPRRSDGYAFLDVWIDGSPYRWNPCQPIRYLVNPDGAPEGALGTIRTAVARVAEATGIRFVSDGTTDLTPRRQLSSGMRRGAVGDRWRPLLIAWGDGRLFGRLGRRRALGVGIPQAGGGEQSGTYVSGLIVVNAEYPIPAGFGSRYHLGPLLLHELGHVMGLAHVHRARGEIMFVGRDRDLRLVDYGAGDRRGLRLLGRGAGCLPER